MLFFPSLNRGINFAKIRGNKVTDYRGNMLFSGAGELLPNPGGEGAAA